MLWFFVEMKCQFGQGYLLLKANVKDYLLVCLDLFYEEIY